MIWTALLPSVSDYSILSAAATNNGGCINDGKDDGKMMPDQSGILMSRLIEPSLWKIGGGGFVSKSAFQISLSVLRIENLMKLGH